MKYNARDFRRRNFRRCSEGVTLVEMIIAIVILSFILFAVYAIDRSASNTADVGKGQQDMQRVTMKLIGETSTAFMQGKLLFANESNLTLLLPIDLDDDGDVLDDNYKIEWGAIDKGGTPRAGYSINYAFVPSTAGTTYSESAHDIDFNEDGDKSDTFALGSIHRQWLDVTRVVTDNEAISPENVLFAPDTPIFTLIDDTGAASAEGRNVRISFIVRYVDKRNNVYSRMVRTIASPRNPVK